MNSWRYRWLTQCKFYAKLLTDCVTWLVNFLLTLWVLKMAVASSWFQGWLLCASELWQWQTGSGGFWLRSSHRKSMAWGSQRYYFVMSVHTNWLARALFRDKNNLIGKILIYFVIEKIVSSARQSSSKIIKQFQRASLKAVSETRTVGFLPTQKTILVYPVAECLYLQSYFWTTHQDEAIC